MPRELLKRFWTDDDRDQLKRLFYHGWPVGKIARRLNRSPSGVRREMMLLGLSMRERKMAQPQATRNA